MCVYVCVCVLGHRIASTRMCFGISYCVQMSKQISSSQREPNVFHKTGEAAAGAARLQFSTVCWLPL